MLEARAIFTHELLENQSTVLFLCSPTVLPLIDEQRQNYSNNQKEREHKETKI